MPVLTKTPVPMIESRPIIIAQDAKLAAKHGCGAVAGVGAAQNETSRY